VRIARRFARGKNRLARAGVGHGPAGPRLHARRRARRSAAEVSGHPPRRRGRRLPRDPDQINPAGGLSKDEIDRIINEATEHSKADAQRREVRMIQNKLEGMIYTNEKVFREFGKLLKDEERDQVGKILARAKEVVASEEKSKLNEAIFELQGASRILTGVMLYNPMMSKAPTDTPS
jgi:hypothetical protein